MSCSIREAASCQRLEKGMQRRGEGKMGTGSVSTSADLKPPWPELLLPRQSSVSINLLGTATLKITIPDLSFGSSPGHGSSLQADEVWRTKAGIWYRRKGIVTLLQKKVTRQARGARGDAKTGEGRRRVFPAFNTFD